MLTRISDKTSLLDLSLAELKIVAWRYLEESEDYQDELSNKVLLNRLFVAAPDVLASWINLSNILYYINEECLIRCIDANYKIGNREFKIETSMFHNEQQYSLEFLENYKQHIHMDYAEHQHCITPKFLDENSSIMDVDNFFDHFARNKGVDAYQEFYNYNDAFREYLENSDVLEYATIEDCERIGITPPENLYTVMNEQRVMSGDPCGDGQRSYSIWLRKYRRVNNDPEGYPTWNDLLVLYKKHPRMNANGYVDWLKERAVNNTERQVQRAERKLTYNLKEINVNDYSSVTGVSVDEANATFQEEFMDVLNPEQFNRVVEETYAANPELAVAREQEHTERLQQQAERERLKQERAAKMPPRDPATGRFMSREHTES